MADKSRFFEPAYEINSGTEWVTSEELAKRAQQSQTGEADPMMAEHVHRFILQAQLPEADGVCECGARRHFDGYKLRDKKNPNRVSLPIVPRDTSWVHP